MLLFKYMHTLYASLRMSKLLASTTIFRVFTACANKYFFLTKHVMMKRVHITKLIIPQMPCRDSQLRSNHSLEVQHVDF